MPDIRTIFKVVICFICFFATTTEAQDRVKLGNEAFGRGDYNKAVEYYLLAIDNRPTFGAYVNLGHCYMQLKQWDKAISTYKEAIALNPDDITADIWRSFGRACFEIAQYDNAIDAFQQAFLLEPLNDQEDNIWIARCMIEQKQWIQAEAVLFGELRREPKNTVTLELLAYVFNQQENWPGIINIYTELLGIEPRKTEYRVALAKTLVIQGKKKKAIEMLEYARYVDLNSTQEISLLLADLYLAEEMPREAAECYARVIRMLQNPSSEDYYRLGLAYFQTGDLISSEQVFRNMQKVNPNDFKSDLYLGHVVAEAGRFDEAIALYKDALKKNPMSRECLISLAGLYMKNNNYAQAAPYLEKAIALGDNRAQVQYNYILSLMKENQLTNAKETLITAIAEHPSDEQLRNLLEQYIEQTVSE